MCPRCGLCCRYRSAWSCVLRRFILQQACNALSMMCHTAFALLWVEILLRLAAAEWRLGGAGSELTLATDVECFWLSGKVAAPGIGANPPNRLESQGSEFLSMPLPSQRQSYPPGKHSRRFFDPATVYSSHGVLQSVENHAPYAFYSAAATVYLGEQAASQCAAPVYESFVSSASVHYICGTVHL